MVPNTSQEAADTTHPSRGQAGAEDNPGRCHGEAVPSSWGPPWSLTVSPLYILSSCPPTQLRPRPNPLWGQGWLHSFTWAASIRAPRGPRPRLFRHHCDMRRFSAVVDQTLRNSWFNEQTETVCFFPSIHPSISHPSIHPISLSQRAWPVHILCLARKRAFNNVLCHAYIFYHCHLYTVSDTDLLFVVVIQIFCVQISSYKSRASTEIKTLN